MQKWEYSIVVSTLGGTSVNGKKVGSMDYVLGALNELGLEGWEVCGYGVTPIIGAIRTWTLKRPIE